MTEEIISEDLSPDALLGVFSVMRKLAESYDLQTMLNEVVEAGKSVLDAERGTLWLYDAVSGRLVMKVPQSSEPVTRESGVGIVGRCEATRQVINVEDCSSDPDFLDVVGLATGRPTRCALNLPMIGYDDSMIGVLQLQNKKNGTFNRSDEQIASIIAAQCAVALQRTQMIESLLAKERLDEEVTLARAIQMSTLPTDMPELPGYDIYGTFRPTDHTGGDTFDLVVLGGSLFVLLGDATGHGFGPALSATQMQAMLRVAFRAGADLESAYTHVNNQLAEDLPDDRFITAFLGFLDPQTHQVRYYSGGQGPIMHFRCETEEAVWYQPTTFPLGALEMEAPGDAGLIELAPGDILALVSDGVYEYTDAKGALFGEQRVANVVRANHARPMADLSDNLLASAFDFGGAAPQADDITVVLIRRLPT